MGGGGVGGREVGVHCQICVLTTEIKYKTNSISTKIRLNTISS